MDSHAGERLVESLCSRGCDQRNEVQLIAVTIGAPQGSIVGPEMFSAFIIELDIRKEYTFR